MTFVTRNILGIPVWAFGVVLAAKESSPAFFGPGPVIKALAWGLLLIGTILMVWVDFMALALMRPSAQVLAACAPGWGFVFVQARLEEMDLGQRIPAYLQIMGQVPRFFPRFLKTK